MNLSRYGFYERFCPHSGCYGVPEMHDAECPECGRRVVRVAGYLCVPEQLPKLVALLAVRQGGG